MLLIIHVLSGWYRGRSQFQVQLDAHFGQRTFEVCCLSWISRVVVRYGFRRVPLLRSLAGKVLDSLTSGQ